MGNSYVERNDRLLGLASWSSNRKQRTKAAQRPYPAHGYNGGVQWRENNYWFDHKEVVAALIKQQGTEGNWALNVEFGLAAANMGTR